MMPSINEFEKVANVDVSVVIPLYNKEKEIRRAVLSVLNQTYSNFELIIVDDGSTDQSRVEVEMIHDTRIRYVYQNNNGVSSARNTGINLAHSELIAFLDADDEWKPRFLEEIVSLHLQYPDAGIYATAFDLAYVNHRSTPTYSGFLHPERRFVVDNYFEVCTLSGNSPISSSSHAATKTALRCVNYYNLSSHHAEDIEVWGKIAYMDFPIVYSTLSLATIHVVSENKATDLFYSLPHLPFVEYILSLPKEEVSKHLQSKWIHLYLESLELGVAYKNIGFGNMVGARENLRNIHSKYYRKRKYILLFFAVLPFHIGVIGPRAYVKLRKIKKYLPINNLHITVSDL